MSRNGGWRRGSPRRPCRPVHVRGGGRQRAWPDPTADAIYAQLLRQAAAPADAPCSSSTSATSPVRGRPRAMRTTCASSLGLPFPDVCLLGNHDLDDPGGRAALAAAHGPTEFTFAHGHTRFVALDAAPAETPAGTMGPGEASLAFLAGTLAAAEEPHRVVLMHAPPRFAGGFDPHPEWGFSVREEEFLGLVERHGVRLVCCAHALLFDHHVAAGRTSSSRAAAAARSARTCAGRARPARARRRRAEPCSMRWRSPERGGRVSGRVLQAFDPVPGPRPPALLGCVTSNAATGAPLRRSGWHMRRACPSSPCSPRSSPRRRRPPPGRARRCPSRGRRSTCATPPRGPTRWASAAACRAASQDAHVHALPRPVPHAQGPLAARAPRRRLALAARRLRPARRATTRAGRSRSAAGVRGRARAARRRAVRVAADGASCSASGVHRAGHPGTAGAEPPGFAPRPARSPSGAEQARVVGDDAGHAERLERAIRAASSTVQT